MQSTDTHTIAFLIYSTTLSYSLSKTFFNVRHTLWGNGTEEMSCLFNDISGMTILDPVMC
jgi:hypothetical protein